MEQLDQFTRAYVEALLFTEEEQLREEGIEAPSLEDFAPETLKKVVSDCAAFQASQAVKLAIAYKLRMDNGERYTETQAGHDFWLTRNGHGAGFWDRGLGEAGDNLAAVCGIGTDFSTRDAYAGDDLKIHIS